MAVAAFLRICVISTAFSILSAFYCALETVGGLMYVPTNCIENDWSTVNNNAGPIRANKQTSKQLEGS